MIVRGVRSFLQRLTTPLGISCLLVGLLVAGLPAPVSLLANLSPLRGACEETPVEDPEKSEETPGAKLGHLVVAHRRVLRLPRPDDRHHPDVPWPLIASSSPSRPVQGTRAAGGHFLAEGRSLRLWVQSYLC